MTRKRTRNQDDSVLEFEAEDVELDEEESKAIGDLADLDSPTFSDYEWNIYRLRTAEDMAKSGTRSPRVWIAKRVGPVNLNEIQADYGGGWFEFWGKLNGVTRKKFRREIEGEPKLSRIATTSPNGNPSSLAPQRDASGSASADELVRRAVLRERRRHERQAERKERDDERRRADERFNRLEQLIAQSAAARPTSEPKPERLKDLAETMLMLRQLAPEGAAGMSPLELLKAARDWMNQGIVLGEKREPGTVDGGDGWNAERVTAVAQALAQILARFTPPPRRDPSAGAQPAAEAAKPTDSHAEVVPNPPAASDPMHRWKGAVETVARNMVRGRGPDDTAATVEDLLNEEELGHLRGAQIDGVWRPSGTEVLAWLYGQGLGKFPQLESPGGLVYLDSVLAELRRPEEAETQ